MGIHIKRRLPDPGKEKGRVGWYIKLTGRRNGYIQRKGYLIQGRSSGRWAGIEREGRRMANWKDEGMQDSDVKSCHLGSGEGGLVYKGKKGE